MTAEQTLEQRVQRLEVEREILRTLYQYGHSHDYGPVEDFLDCFVPDGAWERLRRETPGQRLPRRAYEGHESLRRYFGSHRHAPDLFYKHLVLEPRITVDGDDAHVVSYFVKIDEHPDGPYLYAFGRYRDHLVRCADARWRFKRRIAESEDVLVKDWTREHDAPPTGE
jgi:hypothetical protein